MSMKWEAASAPSTLTEPAAPDVSGMDSAGHDLPAERHGVRVLFTSERPARAPWQRLLLLLLAVGVPAASAAYFLYRPTTSPSAVPPATAPLPSTPAEPARHTAPPHRPRVREEQRARGLADRTQFLPIPEEASFQVTRHTIASEASPLIAVAHDAQTRGDTVTAQTAYEQLLAADPLNRQALLGMAALALRRGDRDGAQVLYLRLLDRDPEDMIAAAGLLSTLAPDDPGRAARLNDLVARHPDVAALQKLVGDGHARAGRWSDARLAYSKALALERAAGPADSASPDLAFNLAVSLEHLGRFQEARGYYRVAIDGLEQRPATFDPAVARARLSTLMEL